MNHLAMPLALAACLIHAQPPGSVRAPRTRPIPPIFATLDTNQDGVIDATELANASAALKKLDRNRDGRLTPDEYRPPRPDGAVPPPGARAEPAARKDGPGAGGSSGRAGAGMDATRPPRPPIDLTLDENGDEIIDAGEISRAPLLLKKLDANRDGKLSPEECLPKRPSNPDPKPADRP